eukprot:gene4203-3099_t
MRSEAKPPPQPIISDEEEVTLAGLALVQARVGAIVTGKRVSNFVLFVTVFNVIVLAMDHYEYDPADPDKWIRRDASGAIDFKDPRNGMDPDFYDFLRFANWTCTLIFAIEISVKTFGLGFRKTYMDRENGSDYNCFDLFLREIEPIDKNDPSYERRNFNTLWESAITCFVIITGDAWGGIMKTGMVAIWGWTAIYFLFLFLFGNFVLINVFVAVILDKLDTANNEADCANVMIRISGSKHDCDGLYVRSSDDDDHEMLWKRRKEDGDLTRYIFSSEGVCVEDQKCWVVWENTERSGTQAHLVSDERGTDNKMPQQIDHWRHGFYEPAWDSNITIEAIDEDDEQATR